MKKTLVIGAAVIDIIVEIESLPKTGQDIYGKLAETVVGGSGYNVQRVLDNLGQKVDFICPIGTGPFSDIIISDFELKDIPVLIKDKTQDNGWNIAFVELDGERTFLSIPGIEVNWKSEWFSDINLDNYSYIYVSGYELEGDSGKIIISELEKIKNLSETKIIFDPSPRVGYIEDESIERIFNLQPIIHANKNETKLLGKDDDLKKAMKNLYNKTKTVIVSTLGSDGCKIYTGENFEQIKSINTEVKNTIGAGDSHTAAFIAGLSSNKGFKKSAQIANKVASEIVASVSGSPEILSPELMFELE